MPTKDMDFLPQMTSEQQEGLKRIKSMKKCAQCNDDLGMLGLARLDYAYAGLRFCCAMCFEEWLDARQDKRT